MPLRALLATLVLAVSSSFACAGTTAYSIAFDTLYGVDLSTHTAVKIGAAGSFGNVPLSNLEGLTYAPDGTLYAVSDTTLKVLMRIDPSSGVATVIGPLGGTSGLGDTGSGQFNVLDLGMAFTCDGRLWLSSGFSGSLWEVDPHTATVTRVGKLNATITGLAARGNQLFGAGSRGSPNLYLIDTSNAEVTVVGAYNSGEGAITTVSPGFDGSGQLFALLDNVPPQPPADVSPEWSTLVQIGSAGAMTSIAPITGPASLQFVGLKGLAIAPAVCAAGAGGSLNPAPLSPLSLLVLALLIACAAAWRIRAVRLSA